MPSVQRRILPLGISHGWILYGRHIYELMRCWDEEHPEWDAAECEFADARRSQPKWVVSHSQRDVGPNATLVSDDVAAVVRGLKAELDGEIVVAAPALAHSPTALVLIDEYRLYLHPVALGEGKPFFAGPRPPLRLVANDLIHESVVRLTYVPASSRGSRRRREHAAKSAFRR